MCDQLASVGVEFDLDRATSLFLTGLRWSAAHPFPPVPSTASREQHPIPWANEDLFPADLLSRGGAGASTRDHHDDALHLAATSDDVETLWATARPWALGQTRAPASLLQRALGQCVRRPGLLRRVDEDTNEATREPLQDTGEAIHSSVRVRLACGGLGLDDEATWTCRALTDGGGGGGDDGGGRAWRLERRGEVGGRDDAALASRGDEDPSVRSGYSVQTTDGAWQWTYVGPVAEEDGESSDKTMPQTTVLPEEALVGPCEKLLLALTVGEKDVWRYAENRDDIV